MNTAVDTQRDPVAVSSNVRSLPTAKAAWDHDPEAERAVLGAVLLDDAGTSGVWGRVSAIVSSRDFYLQPHVVTFEAMERLTARGEPIDVITLSAELRAMDCLNLVGGPQSIGEMSDYIPVTAYCEVHARIVLEHSARRKVAEIARGLAVRAHDLSRSIGTTLAGVQAALDAVPIPSATIPTMQGVVEAYFATLEGSAPAGPPPVPTAWADLDDALLGGLRPGSYLLVGMPGTGKTTLGLQWAVAVAARVGPVLFVEFEQDRTEVGDALLAMIAGIPFAKVRAQRERPSSPVLNADELMRLTGAGNVLHGLPLRIADASTPGCPKTVAEVVALARAMHPPPAMIVIDNLGELKARGRHRDVGEEMAEKMADLRHARKLLRIPIVTLAHPNREAAKGAMTRRLRLSDIAGGAAAERMCDGALLVHREDLHPTRDHAKEPCEPGVLEVYSPKWRGVGAMFCELASVPERHRYASRRRHDAGALTQAPPPSDDGDGCDPFLGAGLPLDEVPAFAGETATLPLGPGSDEPAVEPW